MRDDKFVETYLEGNRTALRAAYDALWYVVRAAATSTYYMISEPLLVCPLFVRAACTLLLRLS